MTMRPKPGDEVNQHFVVSFGFMRTLIFKVLGSLSLSRYSQH